MAYIVTNGEQYIAINNNFETITNDIKQAYRFNALDDALTIISKNVCAKGFRAQYLPSLSSKENVTNKQNTKIKRRQFNSDERKIIYAKTKGRCALCGQFMNYDEFTVDHIQPLAKGGTNDLDNLQPTCCVCNRIKQDILPQDFMDKIAEIFIHKMRTAYRPDYALKMLKLYKMHNRKPLLKLLLRL